jgi:hypothetical protein
MKFPGFPGNPGPENRSFPGFFPVFFPGLKTLAVGNELG